MAGTVSHPMDVVDGQVNTNYTETKKTENKKGTTNLGKDEFLQLLVKQLEYQDPLSPQSNEDFISQLAQFSSLEQMQAMTKSLSNSQALSLVDKIVIVEVGKSTNAAQTTTVAGKVQYVQMVDGKAYLSINDQLYSYDDFDSVISEEYLKKLIGNKDNTDSTDSSDKDKANDGKSGAEDKVDGADAE